MQTIEIRIEGHIDKDWIEWLDGFTLTHTEEGETVLEGIVEDQAAFYGSIAKLRDLGLKLISINSGSRAREEGSHHAPSSNADDVSIENKNRQSSGRRPSRPSLPSDKKDGGQLADL